MSEWRPIETAPRDGTRIVTFGFVNSTSEYGPVQSSAQVPHIMRWRSYPENNGGDWVSASFSSSVSQHPTHWTPLPAPPVEDIP
jgi:hypothetical protein